jgi:LacI family transcriptional regulator
MATNRPFQIACFFPSALGHSVRLMGGVMQYVEEHPDIETHEFPFRDLVENPLPREKWSFTGAITWADRENSWIEKLVQRGVKVVECGPSWQGVEGIATVAFDVESRCGRVIDYFASLHRSSVAFVASNLNLRPSQMKRNQTFARLATEAGMQPAAHDIHGPHPDLMRERLFNVEHELELLRFLDKLPKPAAVWCENDFIAQMVLGAAAVLKIEVPQQLAVLGTGDYHVASVHQPSISTVPNRGEEVGYQAARLLHEWLEIDGRQPQDHLMEAPPVVVRQSTAITEVHDELMIRAQRLINEQACEGLTVDALAELLDVSKRTLEVQYAKTTSTTPGEEIRRTKVERAQHLLLETHERVGDIAVSCGFSEQSKFCRFFKRETGLTPTQFRRKR